MSSAEILPKVRSVNAYKNGKDQYQRSHLHPYSLTLFAISADCNLMIFFHTI